jgi:hypothetical protein
MNKHILTYNQKLNESIGNGSVLLIKGRPLKDGRFLYVTTIKGYVEIKPGIKMVFIGDEIYRVIHKGGDKFSGKKVDYRGEDGLKGVFNLKNPGKPSVVLNHNKTPFHWLTLNYTDIGTALRTIGTRLFDHELILESNDSSNIIDKAKLYLLREVMGLILGKDTHFELIDVHISSGGEDLSQVSDDGYVREYNTIVELMINVNRSDVPSEYEEYFESIELFKFGLGDGMDEEDMEALGLSAKTGTIVELSFTTDATVKYSYDPGDFHTPPDEEYEISDVETLLDIESFMIDGDDITFDIPEDVKHEVDMFDRIHSESSADEIADDIAELITNKKSKPGKRNKDVNIVRKLKQLEYNYKTAIVNIEKNGLSDDAKKRWEVIDNIDLDDMTKRIDKLIELHQELEKIDDDEDQELTSKQIELSNSYYEAIKKIIPESKHSFKYGRHWNDTQVRKIIRLNRSSIESEINNLKWSITGSNAKLKLEKELMDINYQKARHDVQGTDYNYALKSRSKKIESYLNPS